MGEFANYRVNGVILYSLKNDSAAYPSLMEIFDISDFFSGDELDEDGGNLKVRKFATTVKVAIERLEIKGYTLSRAREALTNTLKKIQDDNSLVQEYFGFYDDDYDLYEYEEDSDDVSLSDRGKSLLSELSDFSLISRSFEQYFQDVQVTEDAIFHQGTGLSPDTVFLERLIAVSGESSPAFCLPIDELHTLRIVLEAVDLSASVEYDCSAVIEDWDTSIERKLLNYFKENVKHVLIFTEGTTDKVFIEKSLRLLSPEVAGCFFFFDFNSGAKPAGSASELLKLGKALVTARFSERMIFLFDNDAVGYEQINKFPKSSNIVSTALPSTPLTKEYPTLGPEGPSRSLLDGRAAAIEMYLGLNLLQDDNGQLMPITWENYVPGVSAYQGSFRKEDKARIQNSFKAALKQADEQGLESSNHDWDGMLAIVEHIIATAKTISPVSANSRL